MQHQTTMLRVCITGICLLQLYSCFKPPKDFDARDGNNVYTGCRVKSIDGIAYAYNSNNDPVSYVHDNAGSGNPNLFFKYDNKGRLTEFTGLDDNGSYEFMHTYKYDRQRIVADTMYVFGDYGVPGSYAFARISYPQYDNLNRIVRDSVVEGINPGGYVSIRQYVYSADGNLITGSPYDNKLNPHRTNKVWMFIDRNYSVNNPVAASTYNSSGLPLQFAAKNGLNLWFGYFSRSGATSIKYDCR